MKKIIFLTRDPGGHAAVYPVAESFINKSPQNVEVICLGTAAKMNPEYKWNEEDVSLHFEEAIKKDFIAGLIIGTGFNSTLEIDMLNKCNRGNIPTIAILDYWANYRMRFLSSNGKHIYPKHLIVMDKLAKEESIQDGIPEHIIKVLGHPGIDGTIKKNKIGKFTGVEKKVLLLGEPVNESIGYSEKLFFEDCIRLLNSYQIKFSIKFHPRDDEVLKMKYRNFAIDGELLNILDQYDIVMGMSTIALLHASILGKEVISYQPGLLDRDPCISNRLNLSRAFVRYDELKDYINVMKNTKYKEQLLIDREILWLDGNSKKRVIDFIKEVVDFEN